MSMGSVVQNALCAVRGNLKKRLIWMDGSIMSDQQAVQDVYLSTRYSDSHRKLKTERIYYNDGRVRVFDGKQWKLAHCLTPEQVQQLQARLKAGDHDWRGYT
jgi:hypothetical protein